MPNTYNELELYTRMRAVAVAVQNADIPEKTYLSLNCFAIGPEEFLDTDHLEQETINDYFYSREWVDGGSDAGDIKMDFPCALLLPVEEEVEDIAEGPIYYRCEMLFLDLYKQSRNNTDDAATITAYKERTQEEIWHHCETLALQFLKTLEDRPGLVISAAVRPRIVRVREYGKKRYHGVRVRFTLRAVVDLCNYEFTDPCPDCDNYSVSINGVEYEDELLANMDIPVHDSAGADVGTVTPGVDVVIADATVQNSDDSWNSGVVAEGTLVLADMTLDKLDGSSTAVKINPAGSIAQPGTVILQVAAGETSFTWNIGSEISTATVTAEATGNVASGWQVDINGGGNQGTLVTEELDDGDSLVFTFTPTDSGQDCTFTITF